MSSFLHFTTILCEELKISDLFYIDCVEMVRSERID